MAAEWEALLADVERVVRSLRDEIAEANKLLKALLIVELCTIIERAKREKVIELINKSKDMTLEEILLKLKEMQYRAEAITA